LAVGAAAATLAQSRRLGEWLGAHPQLTLASAAAVLIITALCTHTYAVYDTVTLTIGYPLLAISFALLILTLAALQGLQSRHWLGIALSMRWLRSVGRYSFAMYVFHLPLLLIFGASLRETLAFTGSALPLSYVAGAILLSYAAGFVSYHLLEKHFLKLKYLFSPQMPPALRSRS
jgi:peptidoglycan/LPS O-acetylase OafA/YrhL